MTNSVTKGPADGHWTIHDIARVAGVSAKTVSRVVNGEPGVGPSRRDRILRIIKEVGYHPHTGARSMRSMTRDCVGVTTPAPLDEVPLSERLFLWLFSELYRIFGARGDFLCFDLNPYGADGHHGDYARGLWQQRYAACILVGPLHTSDTTVVRIHQSGFPYIALSRTDSLPESSFATVDYELAAYESVKFLVGRGHKRLVMLQGLAGYNPGEERRRGFLRALEEAGVPVDTSLLRPVSFGSQAISDAVHNALLDPAVTAVIDASGAEDASSIREGARRAGRAPGKDFELLEWTYTPDAVVAAEACAHLWLPVRESASEGFQLFAEWLRGEREGPIQVLHKPQIHTRAADSEIPKPVPLFEIFR